MKLRKITIFTIFSIFIFTYFNFSNIDTVTKYLVYDRECNVIGEYEIEEYNSIIKSNSSYFGYCVKDALASTTTLKQLSENAFKYAYINVKDCNFGLENINQNDTLVEEVYIIGHAYGKPGGNQNFFPKQLSEYLIKNTNNKNSGIALTGDFVRENNLDSFRNVKKFIEENFTTYFLAVGNHEVLSNNLVSIKNYNQVFSTDLFIKDYGNVLIIAANYSNDNWLPSNLQINEINKAISNSTSDYIILLSHQIFWLRETGGQIEPNSYSLLKTELLYDSLSWLTDSDKNIIVISGDYGAFGQETYCLQKNNKIFIANGIGDLNTDTLLKLSIFENKLFLEELKINSE